MRDEEPRDTAGDDEEPLGPSTDCFACKNMDAYWAEKARTDPGLRDRLLALEKARVRLLKDGSSDDDGDDDPASTL
ncbi:MAG: hypothetical protein M1565_03970 [Actinobacteria bacterium]|nr:hypothetical protein [Actinomycetota bacterium]